MGMHIYPSPCLNTMRLIHLALLLGGSVAGLITALLVIYTVYVIETEPYCPAEETVGGVPLDCVKVISSEYSRVSLGEFAIPLEMLAAAWFLSNIAAVLLIHFREAVKAKVLRFLFYWRFLGVAVVPYLVYIELFIIGAICIYCTAMHAAIIADFALITYLLFIKKIV